MFKALFFMFFFAVCTVAVIMMMLGMCDAPATAVAQSLSVEEENELLSQVEFSLSGAPTGEVALFLDNTTLIARLTPGQKERLSLVGNERCGISLKTRQPGGEWEHVTSIGCIDHAKYAAVGFTVDGLSAKVSRGAWK